VKPAARPTLLVVFGPTGSGKTDLAQGIALARAGEIVSADAFAVYRGFDIGTAKPSAASRKAVRHHMIDVAGPEEAFSAGRWASEARLLIEEIASRGRLPIVCGGSGFYIAALLGGLPPGEVRDPALRSSLAHWGKLRGEHAARRVLALNDPVAAARIPVGNLRYTLRALEILLATGAAASARIAEGDSWARNFRVVKVGLLRDRLQLHARIEERVRRMLDEGWDDEVRRLLGRGLSRDLNSFQAIGYREVAEWVLGRLSRTEVEQQIVAATRGLAKRQMTWFARERGARWLAPDDALASTLALLDQTDRETQ
jgi:tRNA dimethylallyltransferase